MVVPASEVPVDLPAREEVQENADRADVRPVAQGVRVAPDVGLAAQEDQGAAPDRVVPVVRG